MGRAVGARKGKACTSTAWGFRNRFRLAGVALFVDPATAVCWRGGDGRVFRCGGGGESACQSVVCAM
eukprot:COSAG02_NODE_1882_length_10539_cov_56.252203_2_plen_67_part_00